MADGVNVMSLQGEMTLNDEDFQRGLNNAQQGMQETAEAVEQAGQQIGQTMRGVQSEVERTNESISQSTEQSTQRQFNSYSEYRSALMRLQWQIQREQNVDQSTAMRLAAEQLGEYQKTAAEQAKENAEKFVGHWKEAFSVIGKLAKGAFSVIQSVSKPIISLVKSAVNSYGEYEQLVGGVETLFGDAADTVIENAQKAFSTAQMSANDYLQTVTSFSASLIQGLKKSSSKMSAEEIEQRQNALDTQLEMQSDYYDSIYDEQKMRLMKKSKHFKRRMTQNLMNSVTLTKRNLTTLKN